MMGLLGVVCAKICEKGSDACDSDRGHEVGMPPVLSGKGARKISVYTYFSRTDVIKIERKNN